MITRDEFILLVQGAPISSGDLYVHFDDITPSILGVAIHNLTENLVDISDILEQAKQIRFVITKSGNSQQVTLQVTGKVKYNDFIYCEVVRYPLTVSIADADTIPFTVSNVEISPTILLRDYSNSDYNVVNNNVSRQQTSTYLQIAERDKLDTIPTNLNALLSDTAQKAEIPDSNYTVSGWIQGRYLGSTTGATSYGSVPGSLAGGTFVGSLHPPGTPTGSVCALASFDRVLETFIHTGPQTYPTFETGKPFKTITTQFINASDTVLRENLTNTPAAINQYDLLVISSSLAQEIVRVLEYNVQRREIVVERGIGDTSPTTFAPGTFDIYPVKRTQVFRIEGNKATALTDSWIWIKDSLSLVLTDKHGIVYREAACPEIIYFRPQG